MVYGIRYTVYGIYAAAPTVLGIYHEGELSWEYLRFWTLSLVGITPQDIRYTRTHTHARAHTCTHVHAHAQVCDIYLCVSRRVCACVRVRVCVRVVCVQILR